MKADANPTTIVYFNNQYVALKDARISILTHALHYGAGVFDGIRGYWDEPQQELFVMRPLSTMPGGRRTAAFCESTSRAPSRPFAMLRSN